ncbi:MAG: methyltransferase, UbiE/COQ5 family [Chloroflexi bacterium]|nr:methyltransferase, UbiE/COQ5 family [Chloroflexota bacterium]
MDIERDTEAARAQYGRQAAQYTASASHAAGPDLARLLELLALSGEETVLDVATGTGHTALAISAYARSVIGVDPTPEMLAEAEKLASSRGITNVRFVLGQAERLPFDDASFDVVTVRRAPHHFQSIPQALGEMHRVLKAGGKLGLIDQLTAREPSGVELLERFEKWRDPSHVRALNVPEWRDALAEAGFAIHHVEVDEERRTLRSYFDIAGTAQPDRDGIVAMLHAADQSALQSFGYSPEPGPEGSFLKERVIILASRT